MILLFGKMDVRTISVAKLLHSARKGRTDGAPPSSANAVDEQLEGEDDEDQNSPQSTFGRGGTASNAGGNVYGPGNVISTPRTIEVTTNAEITPAYRDAIDLISPQRDAKAK